MEKLKLVILAIVLSACGGSFKPTFTSPEGIQVNTNKYQVDPTEFSAYVDQVIARWQIALTDSGYKCNFIPSIKGLQITYLSHPFEYHGQHYGFTYVQDKNMRVGWVQDINGTALGHELGHFILYSCRLDYSETGLLTWAKKYHLPY